MTDTTDTAADSSADAQGLEYQLGDMLLDIFLGAMPETARARANGDEQAAQEIYNAMMNNVLSELAITAAVLCQRIADDRVAALATFFQMCTLASEAEQQAAERIEREQASA